MSFTSVIGNLNRKHLVAVFNNTRDYNSMLSIHNRIVSIEEPHIANGTLKQKELSELKKQFANRLTKLESYKAKQPTKSKLISKSIKHKATVLSILKSKAEKIDSAKAIRGKIAEALEQYRAHVKEFKSTMVNAKPMLDEYEKARKAYIEARDALKAAKQSKAAYKANIERIRAARDESIKQVRELKAQLPEAKLEDKRAKRSLLKKAKQTHEELEELRQDRDNIKARETAEKRSAIIKARNERTAANRARQAVAQRARILARIESYKAGVNP